MFFRAIAVTLSAGLILERRRQTLRRSSSDIARIAKALLFLAT
jgi:hypothetical protein